jgi:hypothetical protein
LLFASITNYAPSAGEWDNCPLPIAVAAAKAACTIAPRKALARLDIGEGTLTPLTDQYGVARSKLQGHVEQVTFPTLT